jgi:hypothetical protein
LLYRCRDVSREQQGTAHEAMADYERDCGRLLAAVPERGYTKLFEVLRRKVRQDRLVYLILAERSLIAGPPWFPARQARLGYST